MPWEHRSAIFLRAAELISTKYRYIMNAAAMLAHSKTVHQSEIDAVAELADFYRYNCWFAQQIYDTFQVDLAAFAKRRQAGLLRIDVDEEIVPQLAGIFEGGRYVV